MHRLKVHFTVDVEINVETGVDVERKLLRNKRSPRLNGMEPAGGIFVREYVFSMNYARTFRSMGFCMRKRGKIGSSRFSELGSMRP
jgi:hypothetical protein